MSKFVVEYDGTPSVSHTIIAQNTDNEVSSVKRLIDNHLSDFEEFGVLGFEIVKPLNAELGGHLLPKRTASNATFNLLAKYPYRARV